VAHEKVPCPLCGELTWAYYPEEALLKGVEREGRIPLDFDELSAPSWCVQCGKKFRIYYCT